MIATPHSPAEWKRFAGSYSIPDLPYRSRTVEDDDVYTERDVYVDAAGVFGAKQAIVEAYCDVLAFNNDKADLRITAGGYVILKSRVITCKEHLTITIKVDGKEDAAFGLYAAQLDKPVSVVVGGQEPIHLQLGKGSGNLGVVIELSPSSSKVTYVTQTDPFEMQSEELIRMTQTQLRMATIFFWQAPEVAQDLCFHVTQVSASSQIGATLNLQANALAQQLAIAAMTGPDTNYAPSLTIDSYEKTLQGALDVTGTYSKEYDTFVARGASIEDQRAALDVMLGHSRDSLNVQQRLLADAQKRWLEASDALDDAAKSLYDDNIELDDRKMRFEWGIDAWKEQKTFEATVSILFAVTTFVLAVGLIAVGDPGPAIGAPAQAAGAIQQVQQAMTIAEKVEKILDPKNLEALSKGVEAISQLFESALSIDKALGDINNGGKPPVLPKGDTESRDIGPLNQMAAWDKFTLTSDQQMEFAVDQGIDGAAEYRLALRKYAIDGKLITQCRSEAIKSGHEYFQQQLALYVAKRDFERLEVLRDRYDGELKTAREAAEYFYDRKMGTVTNVLIEMRKAKWAFKYLSLQDSVVVLDPLKSIQDLKADAQTLVQEVENWRESWTSDFPPYNMIYSGNKIITPSGRSLVDQFKENGKAEFTLAPPNNVGPFEGDTHVRTYGMRVFLLGAVAKDSTNTPSVELRITTSGVYYDTQNNKVFAFIMRPDTRKFRYNLSPEITIKSGDDDAAVIVDSFIPSKIYADPTPFTQWTMEIQKPGLYDLKDMTDIKLIWKGTMK